MVIEFRLNLAAQYLEDAKMLLQNERWNSPENAPGLFEYLRLPLRRLYMDRIRVDYDAIILNEVSAKNAVETVESVLKVIKEGRVSL